jgi:hypothetical protein
MRDYRRKQRADNTSGHAGVYFHQGKNRWHATITVHTRRIHLGWYANKNLAIKVRKNAEVAFRGMVE